MPANCEASDVVIWETLLGAVGASIQTFFSLYHVEPRVLSIGSHLVCARAQRALHAKTPLKGSQVARQLIGELHAQR